MKKVFWVFVLMISAQCITAQIVERNTEFTTAWPYLYRDFYKARIEYIDSAQSTQKLNFNLLNYEVQFLVDDALLTIANPDSITRITFSNGDTFMYKDGNWYHLLQEDGVKILKRYKGDKNDLMESAGAYGTNTSTSSAQKVSSIEGSSSYLYMKDLQTKGGGKKFDLIESFYFCKGEVIKSSSMKNLIKLYPSQKDEIKKVSKSNNINFKNEEDLKILLDKIEFN